AVDSKVAEEPTRTGKRTRSAARGRRNASAAAPRGSSSAESATQKSKKTAADEQVPATPSPAPHSSPSPGGKVNDHTIRTALSASQRESQARERGIDAAREQSPPRHQVLHDLAVFTAESAVARIPAALDASRFEQAASLCPARHRLRECLQNR